MAHHRPGGLRPAQGSPTADGQVYDARAAGNPRAMTDSAAALPTPAPGDPQRPGPVAGSVTTAVPPRCPTRTRLYRSGRLVAEGFPAERIREHLDAHGTPSSGWTSTTRTPPTSAS